MYKYVNCFFSTNINFFPFMFLIHFSFMWYAYKWKIFFLPLSFRITFFSPYIEYMFCLLNSSYSFQTRSCLFYRTCIHTCTCTIFMDYDFVSSYFFFYKISLLILWYFVQKCIYDTHIVYHMLYLLNSTYSLQVRTFLFYWTFLQSVLYDWWCIYLPVLVILKYTYQCTTM